MDEPVNLLPLLPLRDIVVFPGMVVPLFVGREKSVAALEAAMAAVSLSDSDRASAALIVLGQMRHIMRRNEEFFIYATVSRLRVARGRFWMRAEGAAS